MSLDGLYPRLLDAWITEHHTSLHTRRELREQVESALDRSRPGSDKREWGREMSPEQWRRMKKARGIGGDGG